jgi:ribonuclease-3
MVSTGALAAAARRLGLGQYLRVGRGVENSGGRDLNSLLANTFEALMGAIYLDQGLAAAESAFKIMASIQPGGLVNYKGRLQELTQADGEGVPTYEVLEATGPGHRRQYRVEVQLAGKALAVGEGTTRRAAEQAAAREAIGVLEGTHPPAGSDRPEAQDMASGGTP